MSFKFFLIFNKSKLLPISYLKPKAMITLVGAVALIDNIPNDGGLGEDPKAPVWINSDH